MTPNLTRADRGSWIETLWAALDETAGLSPQQWDDVCSAMAWVTEDLGIEYDKDTGEYIDLVQDNEDGP
jgi:hypothetical protein